ncbi:MAG: SpoIIE family protein phosphatase [Leptospiraceae bacterium]
MTVLSIKGRSLKKRSAIDSPGSTGSAASGASSSVLLVLMLLIFSGSQNLIAEPAFHGQKVMSLESSDSQSWWITDEPLDPRATISAESCQSAYPGVEFKKATGNRELPGKGLATDPSHPVIWYCRSFEVSGEPEGAFAITLGSIDDRDRTFLNGIPIGSTGDFDATRAQAYDRDRIYSFEGAKLKSGTNLLLVQVRGYSLNFRWGMYPDETSIGPAETIYSQFYSYNFFTAAFLIAYFTVATYFLFLFLRRQKERENLSFAVFGYLLVIYQFFRTQLKYDVLDDFLLWKRIEYVILFLMVPSFYYFFRTYFELPRNRWTRALDLGMLIPGISVVVFIGIVLYSDSAALWSSVNVHYNQKILAWPAYVLGAVGILIYRIIKRDRDAYYMIGGVFILLGAAVTDSLTNVGILNLPRLAGFAFSIFVLGLGLILANRFVRVNEQVEELNTTLEGKVEKRTEELQETLHQVRSLKVQQDGDYFLTSLLLHPLARVHVDSPLVHVESYSRQKKQFQFKHRSSEIGGDLSIAYSLDLNGKRYIAFINADAMGKSIQGAGGAIVVGTVFKSLVTRTRMDPLAASRSPERWLKDCFKELQDVFCSFDGSMLVSAVIGLLEEETGFLLLLNAEHPWTVSYTGGKARFLEEGLMLRKLGVDGFDAGFYLRTFLMESGDILFLGSDGRDDLMITDSDSGELRLNEDHTLFLSSVERGSGSLEGVVQEVLKTGELTDDLSILRVAFREDPPPGHFPASSDRQKEASLKLQRAKQVWAEDTGQSLKLVLEAVNHNPSHDGLFLESANLIGQKSEYRRQAIQLCERLRIRSPHRTDNLTLLLKMLLDEGDSIRAQQIAREILIQEPSHREALTAMSRANS